MRRRRPQLQVSLFPFLSVLLCTLGSLILLLLVLDQRARRSKAEEAVVQAHSARSALAADRARLEGELQKRLDDLRSRRDVLDAERQTRAASRDQAKGTLEQRLADLTALQRALDAELAKSNELVRAIGVAEEETKSAGERHTAAQSERARLLAQLEALEQLVQRLREAAKNRRPLYSLIPYRGKHGTGRQALYAECVRGDLVFRPGEARLTLAEVSSPGRLQAEVDQRLAALPKKPDAGKPYVLLLIRPSGLSLYYAIVRALAKGDIEIGYEFIDEDWAIDFSAAASAAVASHESQDSSSTGRAAGSGGSGARGGGSGPGVAATPGGGGGARSPGVFNGGTGRAPGGVSLLPPPNRPAGSGSVSAPSGDRQEPGATNSGNRSGSPKPTEGTQPQEGEQPAKSPKPEPGAGATKSGNRSGSPKPTEGTQPQEGEQPAKSPKPVRGGQGNDEDSGHAGGSRPRPLGGPQNNEWTIVVVCAADHVSLEFPPARFELRELSGQSNALLTKVQAYLEQKRQRHPDVRPQLKFVIRRDALRSYYAAAGALESLRLPTKWEIEKP